MVFNYAFKQGLIDRPVIFGDGFKKPSLRILRRERNKKPARMFTAAQIRAMLNKAGPQLKAMILTWDQLWHGQPRLCCAHHGLSRPEEGLVL